MFLVTIITNLIIVIIQCIEYVMITYVILGWFIIFGAIRNRDGFPFRIYVLLMSKTEPLFGIIRKFIPPLMGLDFSPFITFVLLHCVKVLVTGLVNLLIRLTQ